MQEDPNINYYQRPPLSKGQKIAVAVLAFFSFFVIVVWVIQFKQGISSPLNSSKTAVDTVVTDEESEEIDMAKDTDGDGLTDYDELNTYKTSPYLEDSDSDGFNDKLEIDSGKDPNCPTGAVCNPIATETVTPVENNEVQTDAPLTNTAAPVANLAAPTTADPADLQKVLAGQVDAPSLRKMLLDSGMDPTALGKISDEALMASYKETLAK